MERVLILAQIVVSALLIATILVQQRGSGLSGVFGGEGAVYHTRRGMEKIIFRTTIVLAVLFIGSALGHVIFNR
ncbi:MAG: preprotein translocase subunit SecG [bacterium]|nr:preprotein translocase subunit SecG [bacterium]